MLYPELFEQRYLLALGGFGVLSDLDKFLGIPGALHSLVTLVPLCIGLIVAERVLRGRTAYSPLVAGFVLSHPLIDIIDGGPVPLFAPLIDAGIGLRYPMQVSFGEGPLGIVFEGPLLALATATPRAGFNTYGFINAFGVTSVLLFAVLYVGLERRSRHTSEAAEATSPHHRIER
ncbi:hypothetical protein C449_09079 [Halococcus saccharolyticus DSM 5350]|uniref:Membrane-bound metal-dependent hydrolase n=1 Tax=Halococcus saccharolyticus DSM 5350 TaxID=1227455 RepID=M0MJ90_9EURY|nr:hypothetical protein C449_09079 [Halococcus saccharolyticus DSM 5350]